MVMDRIIEVIRNLEHGEEINIGDDAIKIRKVETYRCGFSDVIDFGIMTDYKEGCIVFGIGVSEKAIMNSTFDLEGHIRRKMAEAILQRLKRKKQ